MDKKLKNLPKNPGVYFFKNKSGKIIYIGKAASLRNRVRQYFQKSRAFDPKTDALVAEIADVDWTQVETELDALFVEAEMVRRYMPRYNILLRDDKSFVYVRIDIKSDYPSVSFTRRPLDDRAEYFGPYQSKPSIATALRHLRRIFPYSTHAPTNVPKRACLQAQIGLCPGLETGLTTLEDYRKNLRLLILYITGKRKKLIKQIEHNMKEASKKQHFEEAKRLRDRLFALKNLDSKIIFGDRERLDVSKDKGLIELAKIVGLYEQPRDTHADAAQGVDEKQTESYKNGTSKGVSQSRTQRSAASFSGVANVAGRQGRTLRIPRRIEGYDISHMQGTDTTASMVVFVAGVPDKSQYRKFKSHVPGNDDFAHMREVILRRFSERNINKWGKPDLILIDGGKGQVSAAQKALAEKNLDIPLIGLAKRYETIIIPFPRSVLGKLQQNRPSPSSLQIAKTSQFAKGINNEGKKQGVKSARSAKNKIAKVSQFQIVRLEPNSDALKLLQRIRDESHRFAVSYHSSLKTKRQTASALDGIPGIGPATRKKLIKHFGSVRAATQASQKELERAVGKTKAQQITKYLQKT